MDKTKQQKLAASNDEIKKILDKSIDEALNNFSSENIKLDNFIVIAVIDNEPIVNAKENDLNVPIILAKIVKSIKKEINDLLDTN